MYTEFLKHISMLILFVLIQIIPQKYEAFSFWNPLYKKKWASVNKTGQERLFTKFSLCNTFLEYLLTKKKSFGVPEIIKFAENVFVFNITAGMPS